MTHVYFPLSETIIKLAKIVSNVPNPATAIIRSIGQARGVVKYAKPTNSETQAPVHQGQSKRSCSVNFSP